MARWSVLLVLALAGCAPDQVGQQVGQSLYNASVDTGHALAIVGDKTGQAFQNAGADLRNAVNPPPPAYALPPQLPPPYVPDGYAPPAAVTAEPLGPAPVYTPANPAVGY